MRGAEGLRLEAVTAGYGARIALRDVDLAAAAGEVVGLVGPNGSGKTTAVRVASRALRPLRGRVRVEGRELWRLRSRDAARLVAVVPQELTTTFEFSVLELVLMGRSPYLSPFGGGSAEDYARARGAMEAAGVLHLGDRPVAELSGGEKQRVVLAQALAQDAPLLLLDEPTTHLDPKHVLDILQGVRRLAREGRAVVAVLHDLNVASSSCDRLVALEGGRVVADGPPEQVVTPAFLRDVYGIEGEVQPHWATGRPTVVLGALPGRSSRPGTVRAHVVGGAGRGTPVIRALAERGYDVSVGVLHATDTDAVVAERLNLLRVTVPPFSPIDREAEDEAFRLMCESSVVVVADAPYGPGNVANLRAALRAADAAVRVVLLEQVPIGERDFTGGEALRLWKGLAERVEVARSYEEVLAVAGRSGSA